MEESHKDIKIKELLNKLSEEQLIKMILKARTPKRIKVPALAKAIGASQDNVYDWRDGTTPSGKFAHIKDSLIDFWMENFKVALPEQELETIIRKLENPPYKLETRGRYLLEEPQENYELKTFVSIFFKTHGKSKVYKEGKANAGTIKHIEGEPALIAYKVDSFFTGDIDGIIPLQEDCMDPEFKRGSLIGIRMLEYKQKYNPGYYYYIIDDNLCGMLRKLIKLSEDICELVPEDERFPTITKKMDDILAIFKVEGDFNKR